MKTNRLSYFPEESGSRVAATIQAVYTIADANKLLLPLPTTAFFLSVALLLLCGADALLTLRILETGGIELNPVMAALMDQGVQQFVGLKVALTALSSLLLVSIGFETKFFGRFNVAQILQWFAALYTLLVIYELVLLNTR